MSFYHWFAHEKRGVETTSTVDTTGQWWWMVYQSPGPLFLPKGHYCLYRVIGVDGHVKARVYVAQTDMGCVNWSEVCVFLYRVFFQWPFQDPRLEVLTIYIRHLFFRPKFQGISPENIAWSMVLTYQPIYWILKTWLIKSIFIILDVQNGSSYVHQTKRGGLSIMLILCWLQSRESSSGKKG